MKRKTDEQFKHEVFSLVGDEYTFLDKYVNNKTKLRVKHNKCENIYKVNPSKFLTGRRCPYCTGFIKKTDTQFQQEISSLVGDEYIFIDSYVNAKTKIKVKHNKCGNTYEVSPNSFLRGSRCPYCAGLIKKTDEEFKQEVYDLVGNEYIFLGKYINNHTKIKVKHNKCGKVYEVTPSNFLRGTRCPYCYQDSKSKTQEEFKQEVFDLVGNAYELLEPYVNNNTKLRFKHNKCGNVYEVTPAKFLSGRRCPYCYVTAKKTDGHFKQEIYNLVGDEYTVLDNYVDTKTKIRIKHNKCGSIYEVRPYSFLQGYRCPHCNSPKGELIINKILKSLGINHEVHKTFDDLKDKSYLSYDFYIPDQNILIEYQGLQHYQSIDYFGGETKFKNQQKHDQMKLDYAKEHGYNLIAVPYTEDTFSKIKKYLTKHGLKK